MEVIKTALEQYNVDGEYKLPIDTFKDILTRNFPKEKPKRALSAFMIWKSKNKDYIKSKVTETGRGVIASKAGEIWNSLDDEEKRPYMEESARLREDYISQMDRYREEVVISKPPSPRKKSGRPKLTDEEKAAKKANTRSPNVLDTDDSDNANTATGADDADEEINVDDFTYDGVDYLIDINSGDIYDPTTEEIVGKKSGNNVTIY
jgi:hypothetical protein